MKICYVDEAGCTGTLPSSSSNIQPTLVVGGIIIDYGRLHYLTDRFLNLKQRFFPKIAPTSTSHMGWMLKEIKGSDLRRAACSNSRNERRHAMTFMREIINLCEVNNAKIVGRVWVKGVGRPVDGTAIYTFSLQSIYENFQNYLETEGDVGFVIVDSRLKHLNTQVAHSIFTQKFKGTGDSYDRIIELPAFSHSDNHAGIQVVDILISSIITPIAINTYCSGYVNSVHVRPRYANIRDQFSDRVRLLQHRYMEASGRFRGGFVVSDGIGQRSGALMFN